MFTAARNGRGPGSGKSPGRIASGKVKTGGKAYNVSIELAEPTFVYIGQEVAIREGGRTAGTFTVTEIQK